MGFFPHLPPCSASRSASPAATASAAPAAARRCASPVAGDGRSCRGAPLIQQKSGENREKRVKHLEKWWKNLEKSVNNSSTSSTLSE